MAWSRLIGVGMAIALSAAASVAFGGSLSNAPEVVAVIASIFSILAGVLIAVISILGDPSMIMDQSWRHSYLNARETQRKLHRNTDIFVLYVVILVSLFAFLLVDSSASWFWIPQKLMFFLVVLGFIAALVLPYSLIQIQRQRLNDAIEAKKAEVAARQE